MLTPTPSWSSRENNLQKEAFQAPHSKSRHWNFGSSFQVCPSYQPRFAERSRCHSSWYQICHLWGFYSHSLTSSKKPGVQPAKQKPAYPIKLATWIQSISHNLPCIQYAFTHYSTYLLAGYKSYVCILYVYTVTTVLQECVFIHENILVFVKPFQIIYLISYSCKCILVRLPKCAFLLAWQHQHCLVLFGTSIVPW